VDGYDLVEYEVRRGCFDAGSSGELRLFLVPRKDLFGKSVKLQVLLGQASGVYEDLMLGYWHA
tara:strand:- start:1489 stop:1677 length:189 start_codon:yes stop_codon:yes gene_type:complete